MNSLTSHNSVVACHFERHLSGFTTWVKTQEVWSWRWGENFWPVINIVPTCWSMSHKFSPLRSDKTSQRLFEGHRITRLTSRPSSEIGLQVLTRKSEFRPKLPNYLVRSWTNRSLAQNQSHLKEIHHAICFHYHTSFVDAWRRRTYVLGNPLDF